MRKASTRARPSVARGVVQGLHDWAMQELHDSQSTSEFVKQRRHLCGGTSIAPGKGRSHSAPEGATNMKNGMRVTIVALALAMLGGTVAWAAGPGPGPASCPAAAATPEQAQKFAAFQQQTLPLRQKMAQLRTELVTMRSQPTPDWAAISAKQKEMVDVRVEIQKQAADAGVGFGGGHGRGGGMAFGGGRGMGFGAMGCN
jgi:hypothetical protein